MCTGRGPWRSPAPIGPAGRSATLPRLHRPNQVGGGHSGGVESSEASLLGGVSSGLYPSEGLPDEEDRLRARVDCGRRPRHHRADDRQRQRPRCHPEVRLLHRLGELHRLRVEPARVRRETPPPSPCRAPATTSRGRPRTSPPRCRSSATAATPPSSSTWRSTASTATRGAPRPRSRPTAAQPRPSSRCRRRPRRPSRPMCRRPSSLAPPAAAAQAVVASPRVHGLTGHDPRLSGPRSPSGSVGPGDPAGSSIVTAGTTG